MSNTERNMAKEQFSASHLSEDMPRSPDVERPLYQIHSEIKRSSQHNTTFVRLNRVSMLACYLGFINILLILASSAISVNCLPIDYPHQYGYTYQPLPFDTSTYLSKFGYLPRTDMETGALRNKTEYTNAVKQFQRMAHLPVTGRIDSATINKMKARRCGVEDSTRSHGDRHKRYVLGPSKWPNKDLTYRYLSYTPDLYRQEVRDAITKAFKIWSDVTDLTFRELSYGEADIMVKFAPRYHDDGYPFDGPGMTLAHAFYPGPDHNGDIHFDEDEQWTVGTHEGVNLFTVAAHELGHSLGLGHSSVEGALMYPWYQGYTPNLQLHSDDLVAIQYLYGTGDSGRPPPQTPYPTRPPVYPPTFTTRPPVKPSVLPPDSPPDSCLTNIDASALIRREVYLFKGIWMWRFNSNSLMHGFPIKVHRFFYGLPEDITHIDAVFERVYDGSIVFFIGKRYWMFSGNHMLPYFPTAGRPLTSMGFPESIERVDAAFVWGYNKRSYFITGDMYWRYSEEDERMDIDYPRDMSMWQGVPVPVDAALRQSDGITYFFQDQYFWKFEDHTMSVSKDNLYREHIGTYWLGCDLEYSSAPNIVRSALHLICICMILTYNLML